jgi:hypothetical protein
VGDTDVRVLYIGGSGRSGTTVLARIIGQLPGFVALGEVNEVWRAGVGSNQPCGCGQPFADCPFWTDVGREAFGGWSNLSASHARRLVESFGYLDAVQRVRRGVRGDPTLDPELTWLLARLYRALASVTRGAILVDTSKGPAYAVALASHPTIDLRAIHLARDSRGVAYSWTKEVPAPYTVGRRFKMQRLSGLAGVRWMAHHALMELLGTRVPTSFMRYETFATDPAGAVSRALQELRIQSPSARLGFIGDHTVRLEPAHVVMGNPMRFETGPVPFAVDAAWRDAFPVLERAEVTAITWPLLLRYGYRL